MLIIRRLNSIDAAAGVVTLNQWPSGAPDGHWLRVMIPDAASIRFKPPDDEHVMLETCRGL